MTSPVPLKHVPPEYTGLWRREVITAPGFRDETTQVLWLQTRSWYADLRVPIDRPAAAPGFYGCGPAELEALGKIQGFAGELAVTDGIALWRRDFDRQPPGELPDEARCAVEGDVLVEDGLHADYQEIWRREPGGDGLLAAFDLVGDPGQQASGGLLVIAGEHLMEFRARSGPRLAGGSLSELVEARLAAGDRAAAEELLDTQIRYAARRDGDWRVQLSSHPWLEGRSIWPGGVRFDAATGRLETGDEAGRSVWRLLDANVAAADLGRLLAGAPQVPAATGQVEH